MTYQTRNSLVLLVILAVLGGGGWGLLKSKFGKDFSQIEKDLKTKEERLARLQEALSEVDVYEKQLNEVKAKVEHYPKIILPEQTIHQTYRYLEEIDRYGTFFDFSFTLLGVTRKDNVSTASYQMAGEGTFPKILRFIKRMEYGKPLYKIESLTLQRTATRDPKADPMTVNLAVSIKFNGLFFTKGEDQQLVSAVFYSMIDEPTPHEYDPFKPLVWDFLPPNLENLLVIENCKLVALTGQLVFIQDAKGKLHQLKVGDRVYLGYLAQIDLQNSEAVFRMDRGGIPDVVKLSLKSQ